MILEYIIYASIGRLIIFLLQRFPLKKIPRLFDDGSFLGELFSCDLCLGVYVYSILAFIMQIDILKGWFEPTPIVDWIITGAVTSFIVHLIRIGWQAEYTETVIKVE